MGVEGEKRKEDGDGEEDSRQIKAVALPLGGALVAYLRLGSHGLAGGDRRISEAGLTGIHDAAAGAESSCVGRWGSEQIARASQSIDGLDQGMGNSPPRLVISGESQNPQQRVLDVESQAEIR